MGQERLRIEWLNKKDRSILYAKFSLMELARAGEIDLVRVKPSSFDRRILPQRAIDALSPAQAFFVASRGSRQCRVILDTSESFLYMSSAIADVDLYFCSAYSSEIFEAHRFLTPYPWQERYNLDGYKKHFSRIEQEFGFILIKSSVLYRIRSLWTYLPVVSAGQDRRPSFFVNQSIPAKIFSATAARGI